MISHSFRLLRWLWASPATLPALGVAIMGLPFGTRMRVVQGVIECHSGPIAWILQHQPLPALAMTLGHVIWGQNPIALDLTRLHEHVHVRQYERWGPFFIPAYLLASALLMMKGRNGYLENPFEVEAYESDRRRNHRGTP